MASAVRNEAAGSPFIDGLLSGFRWDTRHLTYSFPADAKSYGANYGFGEAQNNFGILNPQQVATARAAFQMISAVTNLTFTEVSEAETVRADLRLALSDTPVPAWTYGLENEAEAGDVWFGHSSGLYDAPIRGGYAFWVMLHEIGHALGLKHGHEDGGFGPTPLALDGMEYSIMTYRSFVGAAGKTATNEAWGYAQTLMMSDVAALQYMYGANFAENSGPTTYRWDPKTGQAFINGAGQGAPGANRIFMTIWDGGGVDTYDFSNYKTDLVADLRPGEWSQLSDPQLAFLGGFFRFARGNIANALLYQGDPRSLIENAISGSGNDRLIGNIAANVLKGGAGADRLSGLEGDDTLVGGVGKDVLRGGGGADVFMFDKKPNRTSNLDKIADFNVGDDCVYLDNAIFKALGKGSLAKPQKLKKAFFTIGEHATDANDFIIYDSRKGVLSYDADGAGPGEAVAVATLQKKIKITSADFFVV